ncbi:MAG: DUF4197 domain-containing protein [Betaproteobacteria bacterium]|nr:DUF4197 domain-containing protein [Betaproteobacteria bacterium]
MGSRFGRVPKGNANLENYVTRKSLDRLFLMMAKKGKGIRGGGDCLGDWLPSRPLRAGGGSEEDLGARRVPRDGIQCT